MHGHPRVQDQAAGSIDLYHFSVNHKKFITEKKLRGRRLRRSPATFGLLAGIAAMPALPASVLAHGSMELPVSRVYNCFLEGPENPQSDACAAAVREGGTQALYDWNGINQLEANSQHRAVVPDGELCGGGKESHKGLNLARDDWPTTTISPDENGRFEFIFRGTAPHATKDWIFYVTRDDYDPTLPLYWEDLEAEPFCQLGDIQVENGRYYMDCPLPANKSGKHLIYNIWQRSDSTEAFYTCIDVVFTEPGAIEWRPLGQLRANNDLPAGSEVTFRLFDGNGGDAASHTLQLDEDTSQDDWPFDLAELVNRESGLVQIGVLDNFGDITPVTQAQGNTVYTTSSLTFSFQVDTTLPSDGGGDTGGGDTGGGDTGGGDTGGGDTGGGDTGGGDTGGGNGGAWLAATAYDAGTTVTHNGTSYTAKWWTQGFAPDTPVANEWDSPWDPAVLLGQAGDGSLTWQAEVGYETGSQVTHQGQTYTAKWFTRGFAPNTPVAAEWDSPWDPAVIIGQNADGTATWNADVPYEAGTVVTHNGQTYVAKWWTQGFAPDTPVANEWDSPWERQS